MQQLVHFEPTNTDDAHLHIGDIKIVMYASEIALVLMVKVFQMPYVRVSHNQNALVRQVVW